MAVAWSWLIIAILVLTIFVHVIAIWIIWKRRISIPQREILLEISAVELIYSLFILVYLAGQLLEQARHAWNDVLRLFTVWGLGFVYYATLILLMLDQFSSVFFHLRYETILIKRK